MERELCSGSGGDEEAQNHSGRSEYWITPSNSSEASSGMTEEEEDLDAEEDSENIPPSNSTSSSLGETAQIPKSLLDKKRKYRFLESQSQKK